MAVPQLQFGAEEVETCTYEESSVAILPIPYEGTVSYGGGASEGPCAIIEASSNLEFYDEELNLDTYRIGIHTLPPVPAAEDPASMMENIKNAALKPLADGKFLVSLGGEHSVSKGILEAFLEQRGKDFGVLQLDAHADLRSSYGGTPDSHACIMRRVHDMGLSYTQTGIRSMSREEADFVSEQKRKIHFARETKNNIRWMEEAIEELPENVYLTIDIDCLDPSIMPSTGTPEPGGFDWYEITAFIRKVAESRKIIGFDLVELAPIKDLHNPDFLAAKLIYRILGYIFQKSEKVLI